jgi:hypothetical protein
MEHPPMKPIVAVNIAFAFGIFLAAPALAVKNVHHVGSGALATCQILAENGQGSYEDDGEIQTCCSTVNHKTECVICRNHDSCVGYDPARVKQTVALGELTKKRQH